MAPSLAAVAIERPYAYQGGNVFCDMLAEFWKIGDQGSRYHRTHSRNRAQQGAEIFPDWIVSDEALELCIQRRRLKMSEYRVEASVPFAARLLILRFE
jgi:hypothetical protein